jgi:CheY-like chemotaxis protein
VQTSDVILIVENQRDWREMLSRMLTDAGYKCELAADVKAGLQALSTYRPTALVLDLQLGSELPEGEFRGWKLAEWALNHRIPTIIVTAYPSYTRVSKAFHKYKVAAFLDKGELRQEDLVEAVSEAVEESQRRHLSKKSLQALIEDLQRAVGFIQPTHSTSPELAPPGERVQRRLVLRYNRPRQLLSVTIEDERRNHLFSADSSKQLGIDVESFGIRADEAGRSPKWRALIQGIGQDLYARLFDNHPVVLAAYHRAMGMVNNQDEALSLVFNSTRDTLRLPVEFLHDEHDYLCLRHPMSRYLQELHSRPPLSYRVTAGQSLRLLLVASDTGGIPGVDKEISILRKALPRLLSAKDVEHSITTLSTSRASHKRVVQELEGRSYDLWHYAGHGLYDEDSPERSFLIFWEKARRKGNLCFLMASDLQDITKDSFLGLAYLSCCLGSTSGNAAQLYNDDFLGLAEALAEARVSTVIGFRWPVSDEGAVVMAKAFYKALAKDFDPQHALWRARRAIIRGPHRRDDQTWASPILIEQS